MRKILLGLGVLAAAACSSDAPTVPAASRPATKAMSVLPGSRLSVDGVVDRIALINCIPRTSATGSASIGPAGGTIWIGPHRLTIPAGALDEKVDISGTVPADKPFEIDLQPHGLQFRKAAGLVLDVTSCLDVPAIVYLIDEYTQSPPIEATYSTLWHTVACPIWHFSGYAIALGDHGGVQSESSSQ
jgi:hypothetical protein